MASNKECLIIILDVRRSAREDFKLKSVKCAAEILKDKICADRKDYVSFVLLGTQNTNNDVNANVDHNGYLNIVQYPTVQLATWQLLLNYYKFVNEEACNEGEWLDALVVAIEMVKSSGETFKFQRHRIVLFHDFNGHPISYDMFDVITKNLFNSDITLTVVSDNIQYIDNPKNDNQPMAIFRDIPKNKYQIENEEYALKLVSNCNATLCNFEEAQRTIFKITNSRPWTWSQTFSIGTKIKIAISGIIAIRNESNIKLKKVWSLPEEQVSREIKSYAFGTEIEPLPMDLMDGYMLGATAIPYDETLAENRMQIEPGLKFIGFTKRNLIPDEFFCGDSMYWIIPQKGMYASAKKLDALVKALIRNDMAVLCWKMYSVKYNTPKLVVLLPNKPHTDQPASLSMIHLTYHVQHHFWDFPKLSTPKTQCTDEQLDAVDRLIDSMDLMLDPKESQVPRETFQKDLLPFDGLPHIFEQNVLDVLERKVISNVCEDDEQFQEMLKDKNFVDVFWKVPELREENAKNAAKAVKNLFTLEKSALPVARSATATKSASATTATTTAITDTKSTPLSFVSVGKLTPADDFEKLLKHHVIILQDRTSRDVKFQMYAAQLRNILWNLILEFGTSEEEMENITDALKVYRKSCYDFNTFTDYNKWINEIKAAVIAEKLYNFWRKVIVTHNLGLCFVGNETLESKLALSQFYAIDDVKKEDVEAAALAAVAAEAAGELDDEMNDTEVDELLANM